jgi:rod shape-determining protein MreC
MFLDHRRHLAQPVREGFAAVVYPIHALVDMPFELVDLLSEQFSTRRQLIEENSRLRTQQLLYEARLQRLDALERENISLRELLQSSYEVTESVLIAELMRVDLDPAVHLIQISKGSRTGVYVGQPVLDAAGIVGQVDEVTPFASTVRLITDPSHAIPVQVNRNGIRAIAHGTGVTSSLDLVNVPSNADIQTGDLLVSSGLGGRFPAGYPVAHVSSVEVEPGRPFARVRAQPTAALDRSREFLLVRSSARNLASDAEQPAAARDTPAGGAVTQ